MPKATAKDGAADVAASDVLRLGNTLKVNEAEPALADRLSPHATYSHMVLCFVFLTISFVSGYLYCSGRSPFGWRAVVLVCVVLLCIDLQPPSLLESPVGERSLRAGHKPAVLRSIHLDSTTRCGARHADQ